MREIKFRAWFTLDKKMVEHENLSMQYDRDEGFTFAFDYMSYFDEENMKGTLNFELLQYTGLKDKNGKEIYEGDIIKDSFGGRNGNIRYNTYLAAFELSDYDGIHLLSNHNCATFFEVIGNIYESHSEVTP